MSKDTIFTSDSAAPASTAPIYNHNRWIAATVGIALLTPAAAMAETPEPSTAPTELDTIIVEGHPLGRTADDLVQPVTILSGEELNRKRGATIGETLENEPGVATTDFGRGAGRPVIRGQGGPRVQVLENGIASMDASDVSTDHAVSIDPAHADQVEVLKGPATLLYGSGASAGVVNVVDRRLPTEVIDGFEGDIGFLYGSNGDELSTSATAGIGLGNSVLRADYAWRDADDYDIPKAANVDGSGSRRFLANSFTRSRSGSFSYGYISGASSASFAVSKFHTEYGLPVEETAFIDMNQTRYDAQVLIDEPFSALESLKLRGGYTDYDHTEFEAPGEPGTVFENKQGEERIEAVHVPLAGWRGVIGIQNNHRDFSAIGDESFVPPVKTDQTGLFVMEERPFGFGKIELGARVERDQHSPTGNPDRDFTPVSYSLGSIFNLGAEHHLKLYATHAERAPVAEELYAFGPHGATATFERGDADLEKESVNNFEIGIDRHGERLTWQANLYYQRMTDYVYQQEVDAGLDADGTGAGSSDGVADRVDEEGAFDPEGELLLVDYQQNDARFFGFEAQITYALVTDPFNLNVRLFGDQVRGELTSDQNLPRITPSRFGIGLDSEVGAATASITLTRVESQKNLATLETPTDGYNNLSADIAYKLRLSPSLPTTELFLRGRNLLDEDARRATSFLKDVAPLPGASVLVGFRVSI